MEDSPPPGPLSGQAKEGTLLSSGTPLSESGSSGTNDVPLILFCEKHKIPFSVLGYRFTEKGEEPIYDCIECVKEIMIP